MASTSCDFLSGWIAGMAGLVVGHPIDTLKVRQQVLGRPMLESVVTIHKAGGLLTFFRGMGAPLLSTGAMNSVYFGFYGCFLNYILERKRAQQIPSTRSLTPANDKNVQNNRQMLTASYWDYFFAGCIGGAAQLTIGCPIDLVKVQLQSQIQKSLIKGPMDCVIKIVKVEGIFGLYKGLAVQAFRDIPASGLYFVIYEFLKTKLTFDRQATQSTKVSQFLAGGFAGMLSWWSIIPLDVIKSRIQGEAHHQRQYRGIIHCGREVLKANGLRGLFYGFWPLSLRAFPVNGTTFLVYECLFRSCKEQHNTQCS